ncbi:MAG TPA: response regulator [Alphaproteobacteria bacterium]|jgi:DNA-binding response OmpR family regulator
MRAYDPLSLAILVVEDDWLLRKGLVDNLLEQGCTVLEADTGSDALTLIDNADQIDLLITDIRLSDDVSGWDVAQAFRQRNRELPIIYATSSKPDDVRRLERAAFLEKPYSAADLVETCRVLTRKSGTA